MSPPLRLEFVASATRPRELPDLGFEVAVVGRSNVGKSSLINALGNRRGLAHVSKTPGRTRLLNTFTVDGMGALVDCPGYGFAKVPAQMRNDWQRMMEAYLDGRDQLRMTMALVDGEVGPTALDLTMLAWLRDRAIAHTVIATKHDKVKPSRRGARSAELARKCQLEPGDVIWVSAAKRTGLDRLRGLIRTWIEPEPTAGA